MKFVLILAWFTVLEASQINNPSIDIANDVQTELKLDSVFILKLYQRVEFLEARDRSHTHEIDELKQETAKQKNELTALQKKNDKQDRKISRLIQRLLVHRGILTAPPGEGEAVAADMMSIKTKENRIRRSENEGTVAFTAGLTHRIQNMGANQDIVFDHVETNFGNGYNPHHGVFTAPFSGLYLFYTSVLADNNRELWCQIVVNGHNKAMAYARGTDGRHDQGSQVIIVQLQKGDDVAVQNSAVDDAIYGDGYIYSTFSGLLLQDYSQSGSIVG